MYLWPTVAETAVCWKDRATATVDVGWFWCLPPHILPVARQHWQSQYVLHCRLSFLCTYLFSSWLQLFLIPAQWLSLFTLQLPLLPTEDHSSNNNLPFTFLFTSNVTYTYRNCSVKYNHLLEQMTVLSQQQNSQPFGIYNEKQNSYLNNGSLYTGFKCWKN